MGIQHHRIYLRIKIEHFAKWCIEESQKAMQKFCIQQTFCGCDKVFRLLVNYDYVWIFVLAFSFSFQNKKKNKIKRRRRRNIHGCGCVCVGNMMQYNMFCLFHDVAATAKKKEEKFYVSQAPINDDDL